MTATEQNLPIVPTTAPAGTEPTFVPCDSCQAPLDERQRYCVVCGTHRADADDPVARYLAAARRARTSPARNPAPARPVGGARLALAIALVPLAAALGVLVGRGDSGGNEQVIKALKVQKAPVVNVVPTGATATSGGAATTTAAAATGTTAAGASTAKSPKVLARPTYGVAKKLEGSTVTKQDIVQSKKALKQISSTKGKAYVESQKNLPDTIVIP
jgi:hypothetical protein